MAKQFSLAIELLLKWIEQRDWSGNQATEEVTKSAGSKSLLTASEVAQILNISKSHVYNLIRRGDIPSIQFGRARRIRQTDLEDFTK